MAKKAKRGPGRPPKKKMQLPSIQARSVPLNFKVSPAEMQALRANADEFAGGNLSLWIRHAGIKHRPRTEDLVPA